MSMNLHCNKVELWQTPSHISRMCYSNGDGGSKGIIYRYEQWLYSHLNGTYKTKEEKLERDFLQERIEAHLKELKSHKNLIFCVI